VVCTFVLIAVKNNFDPILKNTFNDNDNLTYTLIILIVIILFRIYSVYHSGRNSSYKDILGDQQNQLNNKLKQAVDANN
jgi:amino acid permease